MSLLRKNTLPTRDIDPLGKKKTLRGKTCSQVNILQFTPHIFGDCKNGRIYEFAQKVMPDSPLQEKPFTKDEMEKIVGKNSLTVNFMDRSNSNILPSITTFDKIKGMLIKKSLFERFKECNKENGSYREGLEQLEKEEDLQRPKQNISSQFKLPQRSRILEKGQKCLSVVCDEREQIKGHFINKRIHRLSDRLQNKVLRTHNSISIKSSSKDQCSWEQLNECSQAMLKDRLKVLQKLQVITQACSTASDHCRIEKSINLFAKYTEKLDDKLLRKKRKLQKVFQFRQ